ncbi:peptide IlvX [Escherichia coli]
MNNSTKFSFHRFRTGN